MFLLFFVFVFGENEKENEKRAIEKMEDATFARLTGQVFISFGSD